MKKQWCDQKNKELQKEKEQLYTDIKGYIATSPYYSNEEKTQALGLLSKTKTNPAYARPLEMVLNPFYFPHLKNKENSEEILQNYNEFYYAYKTSRAETYLNMIQKNFSYDRYLDESMDFENGIVIGDPSFFMKKYDQLEEVFEHQMSRPIHVTGEVGTICQNKIKEQNILGHFCVYEDLIAVVSLKELLNYYPEVMDNLRKTPSIVTIVEDFNGTVSFKITEKKKDNYNFLLEIHGNGIHNQTGKKMKIIGTPIMM